jgi:hypothetical protein
MAPVVPSMSGRLPVGSVVERRDGEHTVLVVQETPDQKSIIESWEDGIDLANRVLSRLNSTLAEMNFAMSKFNEELGAGLRETGEKIQRNQRLLGEIVKSDP